MGILGNVLWAVFGGWVLALEYVFAGLVFCCSIIGIPWGLQSFKLALLALWPFGAEIKDVPNSSTSGCLNTVMNIIWLLIGGLLICLTHLCLGVLFCLTIIGIPFGLQHFKLAGLCLTPFGKEINW